MGCPPENSGSQETPRWRKPDSNSQSHPRERVSFGDEPDTEGHVVVSAANASVISTLRAGCHFYLAPTLPLERAPSICGHELPKLTNSTLLLRIAEQSGLLLLNHRQQ